MPDMMPFVKIFCLFCHMYIKSLSLDTAHALFQSYLQLHLTSNQYFMITSYLFISYDIIITSFNFATIVQSFFPLN